MTKPLALRGPRFEEFHLLKGPEAEDHTLYTKFGFRACGGRYAEKIKTGCDAIVKDADVGPDVAAIWLMQLGTDPWQSAGW